MNTLTNIIIHSKIFPRFGLVETTRIIHHNQLLFTKFGMNLSHIQSMTSKVEPAAYYSTVDVKMTSKVEPAADYLTVDRKNLGTRLWFWWAEKERSGETPLRTGKYFEWIHKAIIEIGFRRIWRILQISESVIINRDLLDKMLRLFYCVLFPVRAF